MRYLRILLLRDVLEAKKLYKQVLEDSGTVFCVWSGKKTNSYDIDHMIPFSAWKNNDLWNLLPAQPFVNNQKRDKIPSPILLLKQKELIIHYWNLLEQFQQIRFRREIQISLLGINIDQSNWQEASFKKLESNCSYLINTRGFQEWNPQK